MKGPTIMLYALWHGGSSYSPSDMDSLETFPSLDAARDAFRERYMSGDRWPQDFTYADGRKASTCTPAVDTSASMLLYGYDPRETLDPYPDRLMAMGPRGGVFVVNA